MLDKDNLINILIDWVEEGKKTDSNEINFTTIKDIQEVCGGWWRSFINDNVPFIDNPKASKNMLSGDSKYYLELKDKMIKTGWLTSKPAVLNFINTKEKKEDGWISDMMISNGNHRIAIVDLYKIDTKIPIKLQFNDYSYLKERWGKPYSMYDTDGNEYYANRKIIKYEYDKDEENTDEL